MRKLLIFALLPMVAAWGVQRPPSFGVVMDLSGNEVMFDSDARAAAQMAQEDLQKQGIPIKLLFEDDGSTPSRMALATQRLLDLEKPDAIISMWGWRGCVVAPITQRRHVLHLCLGAWNAKIADGQLNFVFGCSSDTEAKLFAQTVDDLGYKRIAMLSTLGGDTNYMAGLVREALGRHGIQLVLDESFSFDNREFRTLLMKVREAKPEAVYLLTWTPQMDIIIRQSHELGLNIPLLATEGFAGVSDPKLVEGFWQISDVVASSGFVEKFKAKTGHTPIIGAAFMYDAVSALAKSYYALPPETHPTPQALADSLRKTVVISAYGEGRFDSQGIMHIDASLYRLENGKNIPVKPKELQGLLKK